MKFWKINEKALRCVLNFDELKEQNIQLEDMILGKNNAREFLNHIILQACLELNMELEGQKLSVHVMPLPNERVDLIISEIDDSNTEDDQDTKIEEGFTKAPLESSPARIPELMDKKFLFAVYRFSSLRPIEQLAKRIYKTYGKKSSLYKETLSGFYYLCILEKRKKFRNFTEIANEYGILYSLDPIMYASLKEHCEAIIKKEALKQLAKL